MAVSPKLGLLHEQVCANVFKYILLVGARNKRRAVVAKMALDWRLHGVPKNNKMLLLVWENS